MHSSLSKVETGQVVIGWTWVGVVAPYKPFHRLRDQTNPVRLSYAGGQWAPPSGRLPGKLQAADKKEEQHLAFPERGTRVRSQCPFNASNFVQPFLLLLS